MKKMGGMGALMNMMPGMGQMKKAMAGANVDEKVFDRQIAIINSMTKAERANPDLLNAKRRIRIAGGSGTKVEDVNKLMKQHRQMADMMKKVSKGGLGSLAGMFGGKLGGMMPGLGNMPDPANMDPRELERMAREMGIDPASLPQAPAAPKDISQKLPTDVGQLLKSGSGMPGLGGANRFPGLPGLGGGFVPKKK
ncbi:MAG TPA: signal recognition particle protein, partial [Devosia sp.]|nr:signal recognition particle protein [Devosia sp.]